MIIRSRWYLLRGTIEHNGGRLCKSENGIERSVLMIGMAFPDGGSMPGQSLGKNILEGTLRVGYSSQGGWCHRCSVIPNTSKTSSYFGLPGSPHPACISAHLHAFNSTSKASVLAIVSSCRNNVANGSVECILAYSLGANGEEYYRLDKRGEGITYKGKCSPVRPQHVGDVDPNVNSDLTSKEGGHRWGWVRYRAYEPFWLSKFDP